MIPRFVAAGILLAALAVPSAGDIGGAPVSADYDAEFARAADLLERGQRAQGESILSEIRARAGQPAWDARVLFLLASDDLRRKDSPSAARRLAELPARTIGLEPYRRILRGRALASAGDLSGAAAEYRGALAEEEPYAMRVECSRALAAVLEKQGRRGEALDVLAAAAKLASGAQAQTVALERIRLGIAASDGDAIRTAAGDLLFSGADPAGFPAWARGPVHQAEGRLSVSERATVGRLALSTDASRAARLLAVPDITVWPAAERGANVLAAARAQWRLGHTAAADRIAAAVANDGSAAGFEALLLRADLAIARLQKNGRTPADSAMAPFRRVYGELALPQAPVSVRIAARERLLRMECEAERFDEGLDLARALTADAPGSTTGFEPLWHLAWDRYRAGDFSGARRRFEGLATVYRDPARSRRLTYWRARCLEREQHGSEAQPLYESLASAEPADLYALFARRRAPAPRTAAAPAAGDGIPTAAEYGRTDELLRLRLFEEADAEARALPSSRGRDLRIAEAEFSMGRFASAAAAARRAYPEIGTAEEGRVPDAWRRLYYPIEAGGFLEKRAREFGIDPAILRGLVRQESVFDPSARSRAGALGLTQLLPSTAKSLSRSVLRVRYRRAFLYDPASNAQLGAAYLRQLADRFGGNSMFALAAYNGGPTRMARVIRENPGLQEDEVFESHPAYETRDYVRRVLLYAESYRQLYPSAAGSPSGEASGRETRLRAADVLAIR